MTHPTLRIPRVFLAGLCGALAFAAIAGGHPALAAEPQVATLTADGRGTVAAIPDTAFVDIGVTTRGDTPAAALEQNNVAMQAVIAAVEAAGIATNDIATSGFSIGPIYANQRAGDVNPPAIVAYEVQNTVTVKIRSVGLSAGVLDRVVAAGANRISSIRFDIAEPQPLEDEATRLAIIDARRRAELMAEAAGVQLVRVLTVSAYAGGQPQFERAAYSVATPILAGERTITAAATIIFEVAPR